jgi:hypothetical protein
VAFPLLCWFVLAGFLGCLTLFGLAVTRVATPDGQGHSRGFFGGLAALLALFFFGGLGMVGLGATVAAIGVGSVADWNPIRRIEIEHGPASPAGDDRHGSLHHDEGALHARVTVRGGTGEKLGRILDDLVDFHRRDHASAWTSRRIEEDGQPFDVYEMRLPVTDADLDRLEREIEHDVDGLDLHLPRKIGVELGPRDGR